MLLKINKNPSPKELRQFGWTLVIGFALLGGAFFWKAKWHAAYGLWGIGVTLGILAILLPPVAKPLYKLWMGWAWIMGTVVSRVILALLFFGVLTPVALFFRVLKRDALRLKRDPAAGTYWHDHPKIPNRSYYQRLF
jgi:saxitoxin biosynthesis operon SxtJ-like protein